MQGSLKSVLKREEIRCFASESWSICWPMTVIMCFDFLIGLTDVYIAGRLGKETQAAYGFVVQLYFILIIISNALTMGSVSVTARIFTSGNRGRLAESVYSSAVLSLAAGLAAGAMGVIFAPQLVGLVNIPEGLKPLCIPLARIYAAGFVFQVFLINSNGIFRACGMIKVSLKTMTLVCSANICLLFLFVFHLNLGFKGIALAAASALFLGSLVNSLYIKALAGPAKRLSTEIMRRIIGIGWPMAILQALWQLSSMAIYLILSMIPVNNVEILAALTTGLRIESAMFLPAFAFNMANAVIVGNLIGAGKREEAFRAGFVTALMGVLAVILLTATVILNAWWIVPYLSSNQVVVAESLKYLYVNMLSEPFMAWWVILAGGLNGAGDTKGVMVRAAAVVWGFRVPLCYALVWMAGTGPVAVWWAMVVSQWVLAGVITQRYLRRKWLEQPI